MGRILYLSWGVPPDTGGSAIIALNLAKQFRRDEMIVVGEKPCGKPPVAWSDQWPELIYIRSAWPFTRRGARWWQLLQLPYMLLRCLQLVRRHNVDRIVAVYPDKLFLLAGYLTSRSTGIPLYAYFHNTYLDLMSGGLERRFAVWLQGRVFAKAKYVFVISDGMLEYYREQYPELKHSSLPHSFAEPLPQYTPPPPVGSPLRLVFCGNVNQSCEDAAVRLAEAIAGCEDVRLSLLSGSNRGYLERLGILRDGVTCDAVPRDEIPRRLAEADILLLPHGLTGPEDWNVEYRTIFPTKTIEYLISGRPILAHTPPGCFLTRFLTENDCALVVDKADVGELRDAIQRLRSDEQLRCRLVQNALITAARFQGATVVAEFRKWLEN
jgi:glycosyltransferase involved in cell wall biosynthesis